MRPSLASKRLLAVALGGAMGSGLRAAIALTWGETGNWPWPTFLVNVLGAAILGFLVARLRRVAGRPWDVELWGIGALGSFTTFSTFTVEVTRLLAAGHPLAAGGYGFTSVVVGAAAAGAGMRLGEIR